MSVEDEERERKREEHRRRNEANPLESVVWLTEEQKRDFRAAMEEQGVEAGSEEWRRRAKDFVDRLWEAASEPGPASEGGSRASRTQSDARSGPTVARVEGDEGRAVRTSSQVVAPTAQERREHEVTHYPFHSWCRCCVAARAAAAAHRRTEKEEVLMDGVGEFHFDYCFLKDKSGDPEEATTLVGVDKASDAVLAHVVPQKGAAWQWVASQLDRDVRRFGYHGRLVVKSDGENAATDLMRELARKRKEEATVVEQSKPYDSKSNGRAENTVKRLESQVRTLKIATELAVGHKVSVNSPIFEWMVQHSADLLTKCSVGLDGRTP